MRRGIRQQAVVDARIEIERRGRAGAGVQPREPVIGDMSAQRRLEAHEIPRVRIRDPWISRARLDCSVEKIRPRCAELARDQPGRGIDFRHIAVEHVVGNQRIARGDDERGLRRERLVGSSGAGACAAGRTVVPFPERRKVSNTFIPLASVANARG